MNVDILDVFFFPCSCISVSIQRFRRFELWVSQIEGEMAKIIENFIYQLIVWWTQSKTKKKTNSLVAAGLSLLVWKIWMDDMGATFPYLLKRCNWRCTTYWATFRKNNFLQYVVQIFDTKRFLWHFTINIITLLIFTFLLNTFVIPLTEVVWFVYMLKWRVLNCIFRYFTLLGW